MTKAKKPALPGLSVFLCVRFLVSETVWPPRAALLTFLAFALVLLDCFKGQRDRKVKFDAFVC